MNPRFLKIVLGIMKLFISNWVGGDSLRFLTNSNHFVCYKIYEDLFVEFPYSYFFMCIYLKLWFFFYCFYCRSYNDRQSKTFPATPNWEIQQHLSSWEWMTEVQRLFRMIVLNPLGTINLDLWKIFLWNHLFGKLWFTYC